jgi:inosose dehydratase
MRLTVSRRDFLASACAAAASLTVTREAAAAQQQKMKIGYAAITWGGSDVKAIEDISALGFNGIQLRSAAYDSFAARPAELKALLQQHRLTMAVLSSGNLRLDPAFEAEDFAMHMKHAEFVKAIGGENIQIIDQFPKGKTLGPADFTRMGGLLTELGRKTAAMGVPLVYHNHMGSMSERPEGTAAIMKASDPKYVRLLLDVAHYKQGGGDPVQAISQYRDRISVMHIKDVVSPAPATDGSPARPYKFVELGRGNVDLKGVVAALEKIGFDGWAIVELDAVTDKSKTPRECAEINKQYLTQELHLSL